MGKSVESGGLTTLSPFHAEADGNRTRLGALAPTPVLKFDAVPNGSYRYVI